LDVCTPLISTLRNYVSEALQSRVARSTSATLRELQQILETIQLLPMQLDKTSQNLFPSLCELEHYNPPVAGVVLPADEPESFAAIGEADGAVVLNLKALGGFANSDPIAPRIALNGQQKLILLRPEPRPPDGQLAETHVAPHSVAETSQFLVLSLPERWRARSCRFHLLTTPSRGLVFDSGNHRVSHSENDFAVFDSDRISTEIATLLVRSDKRQK